MSDDTAARIDIQDRTDYLAEFFADYTPGVDRFKDRYLADFLEDYIAERSISNAASDRPRLLARPTALVMLPVDHWPSTSCAASPAQIHVTKKKLQQLPSHKNKSKQCPACAVVEVQKILDHAWIEFGRHPVMFKTELPNRAEADKVLARVAKWAEPGDRVVIRRQDTEKVLIVSTKSLSKAKGLDKHPSEQITNAHALLLLREALALPGLAERRAVTWVGSWAPSPASKPVGEGTERKGWLNIHKTMSGAKNRVRYIVGTKDPDIKVKFDEDSGRYVDVLVSDETWAYVIDILRNPERLDTGWDYEPSSTATTGGLPRIGLPVVTVEDRQPSSGFAKHPATPGDSVVSSPQTGQDGDTNPEALPASEDAVDVAVEVSG